ncbi:PH domain-containing protein [Paraferrimonas sp. SM1919]|uniref:PH domain-containing protein n=1 Tax=Paraferrimonas sp. SM1919 TaxID=2662263 RepID=UPI0013D26F22|nr:PH domain-containing protein [Paraferrimonas sp. SM1919]
MNVEQQGFSNQVLESAELPQLQQIGFEKLDARYMPMRKVAHVLFWAVVVGLILAAKFQPFYELPQPVQSNLNYVILIIVGIFLVTLAYIHFADKNKKFALRQQDINYHCGLFFYRTISQPILRIQHVELKQGPIERRYNLARLQVFSAGGEFHTFEIPGLDLAKAEQMRQFILAHKDTQLNG